MTSESTRFLGQPRETNPILGRGVVSWAVGSVPLMAIIVTDFQFTSLVGCPQRPTPRCILRKVFIIQGLALDLIAKVLIGKGFPGKETSYVDIQGFYSYFTGDAKVILPSFS